MMSPLWLTVEKHILVGHCLRGVKQVRKTTLKQSGRALKSGLDFNLNFHHKQIICQCSYIIPHHIFTVVVRLG